MVYESSTPADVAKLFPNGDSYTGASLGGLPHGDGKYAWADGSSYDGDWHKGAKHGQGLFVWPSGARYFGQWTAGTMQVSHVARLVTSS